MEAPRHTGPSSAKRQLTPTSADSFALSGPSSPPDPLHHAFRKDLADVALADVVIASHYAVPLDRVVSRAVPLHAKPSEDSEILAQLSDGTPFAMVEDTVGWAWGYAGPDRLVGYVRSDALS